MGDVGINIEILQDIPPYEPKEMKQQSIAEVLSKRTNSQAAAAAQQKHPALAAAFQGQPISQASMQTSNSHQLQAWA